jgi:molybdate transport system substrate-binding protein
MKTLRILSAGAAQAVTERIIEALKREVAAEVAADFGAVGAMKARVTGGEPVDVIILTQAMIDELIAANLVEAGSRVDLGRVGTGVATRAGVPAPDVATADALRATILASTKVVCPDPAIATAGKVVMSLMEKLGVAAEIGERLQFFPNGYAAMKWLAASGAERDLGITQVTEILPNQGVRYLGPLPDVFQMKTVYSAGLATRAQEPALAREFIARFTGPGARDLLREAGYEAAG